MADFLDEIADYLASGGIGTVPTPSVAGTIFTGELPPEPEDCIAVLGRDGTMPQSSLTIPDLKFPGFQVLVRNADYDTGWAKLQAVRTRLHGKIGLQLASYFVLRMHANSEGGSIGKDDIGRQEFSINFQTEYRVQAAPA